MIDAFTGLPGSGKTYLAVSRLYHHWRRGRPCYANFPVELPGVNHFRGWQDLINVRDALIVIDEVQDWFDARDWQSFPREVSTMLSTHRHVGLDLIWTSQAEENCEARLRRLTATVWECSQFSGFFVRRGRHGQNRNTRYDLQIERFRPSIGALYNTYEEHLVPGLGKGRQALAAEELSRRCLKWGLVRVEDDFSVQWRRCELDDLRAGREVHFLGRETRKWRTVSTAVVADYLTASLAVPEPEPEPVKSRGRGKIRTA